MTKSGGGGLVDKSCLTLVAPWTVIYQAPLSMGFPQLKYWSGLSVSSPEDHPDPGVEPTSPVLQVDSLPLKALTYSSTPQVLELNV